MPKCWLGWVVVVASWWPRTAGATLATIDDPVAVGDVVVLQTGAKPTTISSDSAVGEVLDHFTFSNTTSCSRFAITPAVALPRLVRSATPLDITVAFSPTARGAASPACVVTMRDPTNAALGSFAVSGTGVAPVISAPAAQSFGSVRVANAAVTTASRTITVTNTGDPGHDLVVTSYAIGGANAGDWSITNAPATTIAPGASTSVIVQLDPAAPGDRSATLDIATNDPVTPAVAVALTGTGTTALIATADRAFGIVPITTTTASTITVSNTGAAPQGPLRVTAATITGGSWFTFDDNAAGCLGATICTFASGGFDVPPATAIGVRCSPPAGATGSQLASVTIASDSDPGGGDAAALSCTAGRADLQVVPTTLAFGDLAVATSSAPQTVDVTNTGNQDLTFTAIKSGAQAAAYTLGGCATACLVPPGMQRSVTVTFAPTTPADANITIALTSNDPDDPMVNVAVTGRGTAPQLSAPGSLAFGSVEVGKVSGTETLIVTNTGTSDLTITNAAFVAGAADYSALAGPLGAQLTVVPPGGTTAWDLVCNPATSGPRPGTFRILSNSFTGATTNVALTCTGQEGVLATSVASLAFGGVAQGGNVALTFTLRNTGNLPVTGIAAVVAPATTGYSLDPGTPATLAAGGSVVLTARFRPLSGADGGPAAIAFTGSWGITPTQTTAALGVTGDGLTAGFDVTPAIGDFGDLRFDTTPTRAFCIRNTDQASVQILGPLAIVPGAGTMTGEFAVTAVRRQAVCGTGGTIVTLPQTLVPGELLEVTVRADPANRTGPMVATLSVTSDLAMNPTRTVSLVGTSTSAAIAVSPGALLDFGAVDVQGPAATRSLTVTNTGDGPLDLASFARTADPQFTLTLPPNTTLQPGQALTLPVTYQPIAAAPVGSEERITLTHSISGVLGGPAAGMIVIQGRGIDRTLMLGPTPQFPDTFRNPGAGAPIRPVTVKNLGEATLRVSAVMITNDDDVWQIVDPSPVDIPFLGSHDFLVRFAPRRAGAAPVANLQIVADDDARPMVSVALAGNGRDREVAFGPDTIRVGYTGIGLPVTAVDALSVTSMDPANRFTIRSIEVEPPFAIEGPTEGLDLPPQATRTFAVTFTPEARGPFTAQIKLFLDEDGTAQHEVTIEGQAVFVDAHGGGGCSSGRDLGGGVLVVLALIGLRRRRPWPAAAAITALAAGSLPALRSVAHADDVVVPVFDPTPATTSNGFQLQSPEVGADGDWIASAVVSYAADPLILDGIDHGQRIDGTSVIRRSTLVELGGAYAFLGRFEAGVRLPLYAQDGDPYGDPRTMFTTAPATGTARGDLTVHGKARLWRRGLEGDGAVDLGASVAVTLPTATDGQFTGVDKPSLRGLVLGSMTPGAFANRVTLSANGGAVLRAKSVYANLAQRSGFAWGFGLSIRALDRLWLAGEVFGDLVPAGRVDERGGALTLSPVEWLAGVRWKPDRRFTIGLAGGRGLTDAVGTPALRGVIALTFAPNAAELRPIGGPVIPKPDADADADGVGDGVDQCPTEAEDVDRFDDADGCPDLDNDRDGIADDKDRCPLDPEDRDGFEDTDGCPDRDNDGDGIPDVKDTCPAQAEDRDGFEDLDGCPDLDNDRDGVADDRDKCIDVPETINGNQDDDGCPDPGASMVVLSLDRLDMLDPIKFTGGAKIARPSFNVLGQVAATLRAHPEIVRLRVTCHVQPTPAPDRDQELSDRRGHAVRDWLVQWGIELGRVEVRGFGGTKPIARPGQRGAAALNDRIELIILERK